MSWTIITARREEGLVRKGFGLETVHSSKFPLLFFFRGGMKLDQCSSPLSSPSQTKLVKNGNRERVGGRAQVHKNP